MEERGEDGEEGRREREREREREKASAVGYLLQYPIRSRTDSSVRLGRPKQDGGNSGHNRTIP